MGFDSARAIAFQMLIKMFIKHSLKTRLGRVFLPGYILDWGKLRYGILRNTWRLKYRTVGEVKTATSPLKPRTGQSTHDRRQLVNGRKVDTQNRGSLARPAANVMKGGKCDRKVLAVAKSRYWEASLKTPTSTSGQTRKIRLSG